jgi:hypothetical protein
MTASEHQAGPKDEGREPKATGFQPLVLLLILVIAVWNGFFDILVTRGVKEYLFRAAEHELGRGPAVTMNQIMAQTVADASVTASLWALLVGGVGLALLRKH